MWRIGSCVADGSTQEPSAARSGKYTPDAEHFDADLPEYLSATVVQERNSTATADLDRLRGTDGEAQREQRTLSSRTNAFVAWVGCAKKQPNQTKPLFFGNTANLLGHV